MNNHWVVLIPPLSALLLGFITRRVMLALSIGIFTASLIANDFAFVLSLTTALKKFYSNTQLGHLQSFELFMKSSNLFICIFLLILGILVTFISHSGGAHAYTSLFQKKISSAREAESCSLFLSMLLFIDDYFSSLTVGTVIRPLTDKFKVPRAKLAFLVDSMAAPLAMIIPISSWVAAIVGFLQETEITLDVTPTTLIIANPFSIYFQTLPFIFYSSMIFVAAWFIVIKRISFGPMHVHEKIAQETGNLFGGKPRKSERVTTAHERNAASSLFDFIIPVSMLFCAIVGGLLYSGNAKLFGGKHSVIQALQHANASRALFFGGIIVFFLTSIFFLMRKKIRLSEFLPLSKNGFLLMWPSVLTLLLAWTFGDFLRYDLATGSYLANLLIGTVSITLLPLMFFIVSAIISFSLGSSWGTIAIMLPIGVQMVISFTKVSIPILPEHIPMLFPVLGGILSGAVLGDHISPISDTTIMSSTSTGSHHIDHVYTQMVYALPIMISAILAFFLVGKYLDHGIIYSVSLSLGAGIISSCSLLYLCNLIQKR